MFCLHCNFRLERSSEITQITDNLMMKGTATSHFHGLPHSSSISTLEIFESDHHCFKTMDQIRCFP